MFHLWMLSKTRHLAAQRQLSYASCWMVIFNDPRKRKTPTSSPLPLGNRYPGRLKPLSAILLTQLRLADCTRAFGKSTAFHVRCVYQTQHGQSQRQVIAHLLLALNRMVSHTFYSHVCNLSNMDKPLPLSFSTPPVQNCTAQSAPRMVSILPALRGRAAPDGGVRATTCARRQGGARHRAPGRGEWGGCYIDWTCKVNRATCLGDRL